MKNPIRFASVVLAGLMICSYALAADPAPNFKLSTMDGKTVELKQLVGKAVVVNFWATWCGPCRREIPGMVKIYNKYKSAGWRLWGSLLIAAVGRI